MNYPRVVKAVRDTPWAIRPAVLAEILDLIALRAAGTRLSPEEIRERIGAGPASRPPRVAGAVAVLPLYGVIFPKATLMTEMSGGTSLARFREDLRQALDSPQIGSILIDVNSPGGLVDLVPETAAEIRAARGRKPITAIANTDAASAAYYIASQADELVVTPSGRVGSIGVIAAHDDFSRAMEMAGIKTTLIRAGRYKAEANPYEPLTEEARQAIQDEVDTFYGMFVSDVAKGRGATVEAVRSGFGEGRMVTARNALREGMVDRVDTFEATLRGLLRGTGGALGAVGFGPEEHWTDWAVFPAAGAVEGGSPQPRTGTLVAGPIAPHDTDVVDRPWDGPREEAEIPNDAGETTLRKMYAWRDDDADPDTKAAYSLPHHEVEDGEPDAANVNGVRAALQRLPQSEIPEADHDGVRRHLNRHLDAFNAESAAARAARLREHRLRAHAPAA